MGRDVVAIDSTGAIVRVNCFCAVWCVPVVESVTVTVTVLLLGAVGLPLIAPLAASIANPLGRPVAAQD